VGQLMVPCRRQIALAGSVALMGTTISEVYAARIGAGAALAAAVVALVLLPARAPGHAAGS
jgi:hypothetical protein